MVANTTTLTNANTYTGATTVTLGSLTAGIISVANVSGAFGNNSAVTLANTAGVTLNLNNFSTQVGSLAGGGTTGGNVTLGSGTLAIGGTGIATSFAGGISGTGGLTMNATGTQILTGANGYSGTTAINAGVLQIGNAGSTGTLGTGPTVITLPGSLTFDRSDTAYAYAGAISGTGGLTQAGTGTTTLTGTNSYSGGSTITTGTLQIGNGTVNGTIGTGTYSIASVGRLYLDDTSTPTAPVWANITGAGKLELNAPNPAGSFANWGTPSPPAGFTGTLQLDSGRLTAIPANSGGATTVVIGSGGQLLAYDGTSNGLPYTFTQNFSISGVGTNETGENLGALRVSGMNATFSGNITLTGNSALFTQPAAATMNIAGVVSDGGSGFGLTINAESNPITLSNANTYSGATTVANGTLILANSLALQNSTLIPGGPPRNSVRPSEAPGHSRSAVSVAAWLFPW